MKTRAFKRRGDKAARIRKYRMNRLIDQFTKASDILGEMIFRPAEVKTARAIVFAPMRYGGLNARD